MAILTATVVALVVIVTLMKVGLGGQTADKGGESPIPVGNDQLNFLTKLGPSSRFSKTLPPEHEANSDGHHDFWFTNDNDSPVDLHVIRVSCNRCLRIQVGVAPEGWSPAQPPGEDVEWTALETQEVRHDKAKAFTVPPKRGGWVRLAWTDENPSQMTLSTELVTNSPKLGPGPMIRLEYTALFVDPVRTLPGSNPPELGLETLSNGDERPHTVRFTIYSSTRKQFALEPTESEEKQKEAHPFVLCGKPVPLTDDECRALEKEHHRAFLCGYTVPVTVWERLADGREHDLGLFRSGVSLKTDVSDDPIALYVHGLVRDPGVKVVADENFEDRIPFGTFRRDSDAIKTVHVEARQGTDLKIDKKPDFMDAELKDESGGAGKTWALTLTIRANSVNGRFPQPDDPALSDTAVYLKANGRPLRIPVSGTASQH